MKNTPRTEETSIKEIVWTEKYRPKDFSEVVGLPPQLKSQDLNNLPHLLLVGKPGIGKTTCARIIADKLNAEFKELNASDDRGIQVVREKIKFFAIKASFGRKVLLLDEADGITKDAQDSLRRIMELYSSSTLFILTANYINRIIEPLQSRCTTIEFLSPKKEEIINRLKYICTCENLVVDEKDLNFIVTITYPDIRKSINTLQNSVKDGKVCIDEVKVVDEVLDAVWMILNKRNWSLMRELISSYVPDYDQVYHYLWNKVFESDLSNKEDILLKIAERSWRNQSVAFPEINFIASCIEIGHLL